MARHIHVAIEGPIGVGKTTLTRVLADALPADALLEVFEENPFLSDFYADRVRYAFQTQIFFLLSRYHQQHKLIENTLARRNLVSDYLFAKDWLFAHLNLSGDELAMYERVHSILGEQIPTPDLVVYLKASTETLLQRISFRDRPYDREMDRDYIQSLRSAYDRFFAEYRAAPVLAINTDNLDIVRDSEARSLVVGQVRAALMATSFQPPLPEMDDAVRSSPGLGLPMAELQGLNAPLKIVAPSSERMLDAYLLLSSRMGALAGLIGRRAGRFSATSGAVAGDSEGPSAISSEFATALTDILASLIELAAGAGIDLAGAERDES